MKKNTNYAEALAQEDLTCDFIDSVVMGSFTEDGFVNLGDDYTPQTTGWFGKNRYAQEYGHHISEITPLQIFGLIFSILAVVILGAWSTALHKSLGKPVWKARRGDVREPRDISRNPSGIMMGRSASEASYYVN